MTKPKMNLEARCTCGWAGEYQDFTSASGAARAHLQENPGDDHVAKYGPAGRRLFVVRRDDLAHKRMLTKIEEAILQVKYVKQYVESSYDENRGRGISAEEDADEIIALLEELAARERVWVMTEAAKYGPRPAIP